MISRVSWKYWSGNQKKTDRAFFKSREAADKFVEGLGKEEVFDVEITDNLTLADVR